MSDVIDASFPGGAAVLAFRPAAAHAVTFDRREWRLILKVYGFKVAEGEWRDYALDMLRDRAVFSIFRRAAEMPLFRIEKAPKNARRQGAYAVLSSGGRVLKRGHDLEAVLRVFSRPPRLVG